MPENTHFDRNYFRRFLSDIQKEATSSTTADYTTLKQDLENLKAQNDALLLEHQEFEKMTSEVDMLT